MVIRAEDVGYFHKEEIIIAQDKLDQIDILDSVVFCKQMHNL